MKTKPEYREQREELKTLCDSILADRHLTRKIHYNLEVTGSNRGWTHVNMMLSTPKRIVYNISVPEWALVKHGMNYAKAYAIHELCHLITGTSHNHDKLFKHNEMIIMKRFLGAAKIVRNKRTYIHKAYNLAGESLFDIDKDRQQVYNPENQNRLQGVENGAENRESKTDQNSAGI